jgi:hypothetical protein
METQSGNFTIGALADTAGINVEIIRLCQRNDSSLSNTSVL